MSENSTLDTSNIKEDEDDVITLQEAIQSEQALIADANAVLGACDAKNCTYSQVSPYVLCVFYFESFFLVFRVI